MLKKFFVKLFLFIFPLALLTAFSVFVLVKSKETGSLDDFCEKQYNAHNRYLVGLALTNPVKAIKLRACNLRKAPVMALGTSRTMIFRSAFFHGFDTFYNAGGAVAQLKHCRVFLNKLNKEALPKVIILGIDQNFMNHEWDSKNDVSPAFLEDEYADAHTLVSCYHSQTKVMLKDYAAGKFKLSNLFDPRIGQSVAGLNAIINDNGIRNDGSWQYGKIINHPENKASYHDYEFSTTFNSIRTGTLRYRYGSEVSPRLLAELDSLLDLCKANNIHVVGFLPPYAHTVWEKMKNEYHEQYAFLWVLHERMQPVFSAHGYPLFDFSDLAWLDCNDKQVFDGDHASEIAYGKMLKIMAAQDSVLAPYCDTAAINERLSHPKNDYVLFTDNEYER